ncbi:hypothetical protein HDU86_004840 [Geranomyces michiganensis]|nr:hypothetical protein HDU86_004840 [Geranomyces michiganensis]
MNTFKLLLTVALALVPVQAALPPLTGLPTGEGWTTVIRHECGGGFELTPKMPWGINFDIPFIERAMIAVRKKLRDRAKCKCPGLSDADFNLMYDPVTAFLNTADTETKYPTTSCAGEFPATFLALATVLDVSTLPTTCTLATWQKSGTCTMQYSLEELGVKIGISLWQCTGSIVPGFALNCLGDNCATLFQPCNTNADCSGSPSFTCATLTGQQTAWDVMTNMNLYDSATEFPGCINPDSQDPTAAVVPFVMTYLRSLFPKSKTNWVAGMCGINEISNGALRRAFNSITTTSSPTAAGGCVSDEKQTLNVPLLQEWSGITAPGVLATTPGQTLLEPTTRGLLEVTTGKAGRLAHVTCDGQALLLDGQFRMRPNPWGLTRIANYFTSLVKASQDCHISSPWTMTQFNLRYGVWSLLSWLYYGDSAAASVKEDLGANFPKVKTWMAGIAESFDDYRIKLPSTCSYASWKSGGTCAMEFTGLGTLLQLDVKLQASATQCSSAPWPQIKIDCDSDCGSLAVCTDIMDALDVDASDKVFSNIYSDPIGALMPKDVADACKWTDFNKTDTSACGGAAKGLNELNYILQFAFNVDSSTGGKKKMRRATTASSRAKMCLPSKLDKIGDRATPWVDEQLTIASASKLAVLNTVKALTYSDPDPFPFVPIDVSTADFSVKATLPGAGASVATNRALGEVCYANKQCASGQCTNSFCVEAGKSSISASCSTSDDCATGNCFQGACQVKGKKLALGKTCSAAAECESETCTTGVCKLPAAAAGKPASLVAKESNTLVGCAPNVPTKIALPGNLGLALNAADSATVNVTVAPTPPTNVAVPDKGISTYYNFDIASTAGFQANLTFAYVDELLTSNGYAAEDLTWARFDTKTNSWSVQRGIVDQTAKTVTYQTSQFSTWTVIAAKSAAAALSPLPLAILGALAFTITAINL